MTASAANDLYQSIVKDLSARDQGQLRVALLADMVRELGAELMQLDSVELAAYAGRPSAVVHAELLEKHILQTSLSLDRAARMRLKGAERFRALLEAKGGTYSVEDMARVLGTTPDAVRKRAQRRQLLAIKQGKELRFPVFQLAADRDEPLAGLERILAAMKSRDPAEIILFLLQPLDGDETAMDLLRQGAIERVENAARAYLEQLAT